jgi:hypothetical protein
MAWCVGLEIGFEEESQIAFAQGRRCFMALPIFEGASVPDRASVPDSREGESRLVPVSFHDPGAGLFEESGDRPGDAEKLVSRHSFTRVPHLVKFVFLKTGEKLIAMRHADK